MAEKAKSSNTTTSVTAAVNGNRKPARKNSEENNGQRLTVTEPWIENGLSGGESSAASTPHSSSSGGGAPSQSQSGRHPPHQPQQSHNRSPQNTNPPRYYTPKGHQQYQDNQQLRSQQTRPTHSPQGMYHAVAGMPLMGDPSLMGVSGGQQVVQVHVQMGETMFFQLGDQMQCIPGPATVRMLTNNTGAIPMAPPVVAIPYDDPSLMGGQGGYRPYVHLQHPQVAIPTQVQQAQVQLPVQQQQQQAQMIPTQQQINPHPPTPNYATGGGAGGAGTGIGCGQGSPCETGGHPTCQSTTHPHRWQRTNGSAEQSTVESAPMNGACGKGEGGRRGEGSSPIGGGSGSVDGDSNTRPRSYNTRQPNFGDERSHRQYMKLRKRLDSRSQNVRGRDKDEEPKCNGSPGIEVNSTDCNQNTLMPNSVILSGADKENGGGGGGGRPRTSQEKQNQVRTTTSGASDCDNVNQKASAELELRELLTCVSAPEVCDVRSRSALVKWSSPSPEAGKLAHLWTAIDVHTVIPELSYELYISLAPGEKSGSVRDRVKQVACGKTLEFRLDGLNPATEYQVALQAVSDKIKGTPSTPCVFETLKCEPTTPQAPKLVSRTKNSLELKWLSTPDNGAKVIEYILLMSELKEDKEPSDLADFTEAYRGPNKSFKLARLTQNNSYFFRLAAANSVGLSDYSNSVSFSTCGAAPSRPEPPQLVRVGSDFIELRWEGRNNECHGLYMMNEGSAHGFVPVYNGHDTSFRAVDLCRSSKYSFKLNAQNEDGTSAFSNAVHFETRAEVPGRPGRPSPMSKVAPRQCVLSWAPPGDTGGSSVQGYCLEMCMVAKNAQSGAAPPSEFQVVYTGTDNKTLVGGLMPGNTYRFRVGCYSEAGQSQYSEPSCVCTPCECPGQCGRPSLLGRPKAHWLKVKWTSSELDGGGSVYQYELKLCKSDIHLDGESDDPTPSPSPERTLRSNVKPTEGTESPWIIGYKGPENECQVLGLLPGTKYRMKVRAYNAAGPGPWSEILVVESGPGCPSAVTNPHAAVNSSGVVAVYWQAPASDGGSEVTSYIVEHYDGAVDPTEFSLRPDQFQFSEVFRGLALSVDLKGLSPNSTQSFRVAAANYVGASPWSPVVSCATPASTPGPVAAPALIKVTHNTATVRWQPPSITGGAEIIRYMIDVTSSKAGGVGFSLTKEVDMAVKSNGKREKDESSDEDEEEDEDDDNQFMAVVTPLEPETSYRIRIRAVNRVGAGVPGASLKLTTHCEPPQPPTLECSIVGHNFLKLSWRKAGGEELPRTPQKTAKENKEAKFIQYSLEIVASNGVTLLYQGPVTSYKVTRLKENFNYAFRIRASNLDSEGEWSPLQSFSTCYAPPGAPPPPKVEKATHEGEFVVDWSAATTLWKFSEPCLFILELGDSSCEDKVTWCEIYQGSEERTRISCSPEEGESRFVRLAQVRMVDLENNIKSPYSSPVSLCAIKKSKQSPLVAATVHKLPVKQLPQEQLHITHQHAKRNSLRPHSPLPERPVSTIGQLGDHHWAAIFVGGFAFAAIAVAFLLEKLVHVSS